ncbi:MAG: hypothetical protein NC548_31535 [Lachnospiraceae bacterium]|nr:hypothetical protein [Lachnospiraceae bacterium]
MNQRYFVAIHLRNVLSIPFKQRKEMVEALVDGISITGDMSCFISITDILDACDKQKLSKMLEMKLKC